VTLRNISIIVGLLVLYLLILCLHNVDLRVKNKLIANDLKFLLIQLFDLSIVVPAHLLVFLLQERNVLEAGLFVVEQGTDPGLLLIIYDFLLQDLEFQLHEVNLLLEI
jgi:hypothetical protein